MLLVLPSAALPACPLGNAAARRRRRSRRGASQAATVVVASSSGVPFTPAQTRQALLAKEALFVDVRSAREFRDEALPNTVNLPLYLVPPSVPRGAIDSLLDRPDARERVPMNTEFEEKLNQLMSKQDSKRVLFLCSNGKRSAFIASALAEDGVYQAAFMVGGLNSTRGWRCIHPQVCHARGRPRECLRIPAGVPSGRTARRRTQCCLPGAATRTTCLMRSRGRGGRPW